MCKFVLLFGIIDLSEEYLRVVLCGLGVLVGGLGLGVKWLWGNLNILVIW